jgi:hypothetical protein
MMDPMPTTQMFDPNQIGLTAHAVAVIDGDIWQAEYQQGRSGRNATVGPQMIDFAAHFCIQRHYLSAAKVPR